MGRTSFVILAMGCLLVPIAAEAQQSGGTGNRGEASLSASAGAPTIEDNIEVARRDIEKARAEKTISPQKADRAEHRLMVIAHKLRHLTKEVSDVRDSLN